MNEVQAQIHISACSLFVIMLTHNYEFNSFVIFFCVINTCHFFFRVFNTVMKCLDQHLNPTFSPTMTWSFLINCFSKMLHTIVNVLQIFTNQDLIVSGNILIYMLCINCFKFVLLVWYLKICFNCVSGLLGIFNIIKGRKPKIMSVIQHLFAFI